VSDITSLRSRVFGVKLPKCFAFEIAFMSYGSFPLDLLYSHLTPFCLYTLDDFYLCGKFQSYDNNNHNNHRRRERHHSVRDTISLILPAVDVVRLVTTSKREAVRRVVIPERR